MADSSWAEINDIPLNHCNAKGTSKASCLPWGKSADKLLISTLNRKTLIPSYLTFIMCYVYTDVAHVSPTAGSVMTWKKVTRQSTLAISAVTWFNNKAFVLYYKHILHIYSV